MEVILKGEPKEIAALALAVQERPEEQATVIAPSIEIRNGRARAMFHNCIKDWARECTASHFPKSKKRKENEKILFDMLDSKLK